MDSAISTLFSQRDLGSLQSEAPTPLYYQIYSLLKHRILDGAIPNGTQMPTEQQLAEAFSVSRITAKRAMDELAGEKLVDRRRGKGTHVTYHYEPEAVEAPLSAVLDKLASTGLKTKVKVLDVGKLVPPGNVRSDLGLESGEKAHRVIRVRYSDDGAPFAHHVSWTPGIKSGYTERELGKRVRLDILKDNGIEIHHIEQCLGAVAAPDFVARELGMQEGDAVLTLTRRSFTADGRVVDILYCHYHPRRFQYRMSMSMDDYRS
jgi:GntR family transcriptional regulator